MAETAGKKLIKEGRKRPALGYVDAPGNVPGNAFAMVVEGDSMEPELLEKDVVVIVPCTTPKDGNIVAIHHAGGFWIKRFKVIDGAPHFVPDNPKYETKKMGLGHEIVGKVIQIQRPL